MIVLPISRRHASAWLGHLVAGVSLSFGSAIHAEPRPDTLWIRSDDHQQTVADLKRRPAEPKRRYRTPQPIDTPSPDR